MNFKTQQRQRMGRRRDCATKDDVMVYAIGLESRTPHGRRQSPLPGVGGGGSGG